MTCAMCKQRGKNWDGADPKCAFLNGGSFTPDNWNCATVNAIRDVCGEWGDERHPAVDWRAHNARMDSGDQKYATIEIDDSIELPSDNHEGRALCLWVTWYKLRGRTEAMWLLSEDGDPKRPTEADCLAIISGVEKAKVAA